MAFIPSQLPMQCSPAKLLNESDVVPPVKYLHESNPGISKQEDIKMPSENSLQLKVDEDELIDIIACEDIKMPSENSLQLRVDEDEFIGIITCEDITGDYSDDTLDGGYISGKSSPNSDYCQGVKDDCSKFNDAHDECHITEKSAPCLDSCKDRDEPMRDCAPDIVVSTPNSSQDIVETPLPPKAANGSLKRKPEMKELKIPLKKLRVTTNCLNKKLELEEDEYIFCSQCDKLQIGHCSIHCGLHWVKEPSTVVVTEGLTKARATIPKNMELKTSSIPDAGLGIFAMERFESDVVFGPYWGEKIDVANVTPNMDQGYMWDIIEHGRVTHVVDARDESQSNWLRFVNCARNEDEQNLVAFQYRGEIYYRSYKTIEPGMELLVWYGDRYACDLDILNKDKKPADGPVQCQKCFMICSGPISLASHNKFRCQMSSEHHLWRCMHCDRSFKKPSSLHFHKNIHKGIKPFSCKLCGKVFAFPASRRRHYDRQHSQRETVSCKICGKVFVDKNGLDVHEKKCHNQDAYKCQVCGQRFTTRSSLSNHKRVHERSDAQNVCSICKLTFSYSFNLVKHLREKHPRLKLHRCGKCGKLCQDKRRLAVHFAVKHSTKHGNGSCRLFSRDDRLKERLLPHVKENKQHSKKRVFNSIRCKKCKRTFERNKFGSHSCIVPRERHGHCSGGKREVSLSLPTNRSLEQKSAVRCEFCFKAFPSSLLMNHHRASHFRKINPSLPIATYLQPAVPSSESRDNRGHNNKDLISKTGNFGCNVCGKLFQTKTSLASHKTHHSLKRRSPLSSDSRNVAHLRKGVRQFSCKKCNKSFLTETSLRSHKSHHSRSSNTLPNPSCKKYDVCGGKFEENKSLREDRVGGWNTLKEHLLTSPSFGKHSNGSAFSTSEPKLFRCDVCGKKFRSKATLHSHKGHHSRGNYILHPNSKSKTHECSTCLEFFHSRRSLACHRNRMHDETDPASFICPFCDSSFSSREDLWVHKQNLHSTADPFTCLRCNGRFATKHGRDRHVCLVKEDDKETSMKQEATVESNPALDTDSQETHECRTCLESFPSRRSLSNHKRSHVGVTSPCVCSVCHKGLSSKRSLLRHKQSQHSSTILVGDSKSSSKGDDSNHNSIIEIATCDKTAKCFRCAEACLSTNDCREHLPVQNGIGEPLQKTTSQPKIDRPSTSLVKEDDKETSMEQEATAESKPALDTGIQETHECRTCLESFPSRRSLSNHKRSHVGVTSPCVCSVCQKGLSSKRSLLRHKQSQHSSTILVGDSKLSSKGDDSNYNSIIEIATCDKTTKCFRCAEACLSTDDCRERLAVKNGIEEPLQKTTSQPKIDRPSTNNVNVDSGRTPKLNGEDNVGLWKCLYCEKQYHSADSLRKHTKNKHGKKKWLGKEEEERIRALFFKCIYCEKEFDSLSGKMQHVKKKHSTCELPPLPSGSQSPFSTELSTKMAVSWDTSPARKSSKPTKGAFKCQYCDKGFCNANSRYKHIMIAHSTNLVTIPSTPHNSLESGHNYTAKPMSQRRQQESRGVVLSHHEVTESASHINHQLREVKTKKAKKTNKRMSLGIKCRCRYCGKSFFSKSSRCRHELVHKKEVGLSSSLLGQENHNVNKGNFYGKAASPSAKQLPPAKVELLPSRSGCCLSTKKVASATLTDTDKMLLCRYCPKRFFSVSGRYKHVRRVHSGQASANPKVCRSFAKVSVESDVSSISPAKKMRLSSISSDQPRELAPAICQTVKSTVTFDCSRAVSTSIRQSSTKSKAFQCDHCTKSFHTCSILYKHYLLVHSRSGNLQEHGSVRSKADPANTTSQPSVPHPADTVNPINSELAVQSCFGGLNHSPLQDNDAKVVSATEEDLDSFTCRICAKFFQTKVDWAAHINEEHKNVERVVCGISSPSRPVLRAISAVFHDNSLGLPRKRGVTRTQIKKDKQLPPLCARNLATPNHVVCLPTKPNIAKTFQCDICLRFFSRKDCVSRHKKTKHCNEKPFQCNNCGFAAKKGDSILRHNCSHNRGRI